MSSEAPLPPSTQPTPEPAPTPPMPASTLTPEQVQANATADKANAELTALRVNTEADLSTAIKSFDAGVKEAMKGMCEKFKRYVPTTSRTLCRSPVS